MIEVGLERVTHGSVVVGRSDGEVIFVTGGLPGERVVVEITEKGSRFDRGRVVRVLEASPRRVEPPCPITGEYGGCDWQRASPELQFDLKMAVVAGQLSRLTGITWPGRAEAIQPAVNWRTRMRYSVSDGRVGLRGWRSHEVVPLPGTGCLAAVPGLFPAQLNELAEEAESLSVVRTANRVNMFADGKLLTGPPRVRERAGKFSFQMAASGFWQVHSGMAGTLLDAVVKGLKPKQGDLALDLYYGSGLSATDLGHSGAGVFGVELDREATANVRVNVPRERFLALLLAKALRRFPSGADLVILDLPRRGVGTAVVACMADLAPKAVAYITCDPASLTRDLVGFATRGYEANRVRAFDLFPVTHRVECVVILKPATRA